MSACPSNEPGATLFWYAAGQKPDPDGVRTGRVSRLYELISRDAPFFTENGTEDDWTRVGGEVRTNWTYQIDSGDANSITNLSRDLLRFYRASYGGRWQPSNPRPLASEEVYAMNRVPLVEGYNYIALHGVPWTNTLAGVFGTDLTVLPAGTQAATEGCTRVEFFNLALTDGKLTPMWGKDV